MSTKPAEGDDYDMGDMWRDVKAAQQKKRASNRAQSAELLKAACIRFDSKNGGAHLIVSALGKTFDFWPGTGLWKLRGSKHEGYGVKGLIRMCTPMQGT